MTQIKTLFRFAVAILLLGVLACNNSDRETAPTPTSTPSGDPVVPIEVGSDGFGEVVIEASYPPDYVGASQPSVEHRIWLSDVVVRATMLSTGDGQIRFQAVEYLKGTGSNTFTVEAETANRNATWDGQEAILFLTTVAGTGEGSHSLDQSGGSTGSIFTFSDGYRGVRPTGNLPEGYTIDANNPAWMPASTAPSNGAGGASTSSGSYITETQAPDGSANPSITLADIKSEIAYQQAKTTSSYRNCVQFKLNDIAFVRDNLAYYGQVPQLATEEKEIEAGLPAGTVIYAHPRGSFAVSATEDPPQYSRHWITGDDAEYFSARLVDDDGVVTNGYSLNIETARPLPAGTFTFQHQIQLRELIPCNHINEPYPDGLTYSITVTAPHDADEAALEAFFDPQTIGSGDGYVSSGDLTTGDLSNADFTPGTAGSAATSITALTGDASNVVLSLDPYNALAGHTLDFITGDGTTSLTLTGDAATGDSTAKTLTWAVGSKPWSSGDELMLRISASPPDHAQRTRSTNAFTESTCDGAVTVPLWDDPIDDELLIDCEAIFDGIVTLQGGYLTRWNPQSNLDDWRGVSVGVVDGVVRVTGLDLTDMGMSGTFPASFAKVDTLTSLKLTGNTFTGCIPPYLYYVADHDLSTLGLDPCT